MGNAVSMTETRPSAAPAPTQERPTIASVEAIKLKLPYKKAISFASQTESTSHYVILRIVLSDGTEGIAESVCRPGHTGDALMALLERRLDNVVTRLGFATSRAGR
jgi:hypothetical protein